MFIQVCDAHAIERSLDSGAVHDAWLAWSSAADSVVVLAFVEAGGPIPGGGLVRGRCSARFRSVALGGPRVHRFLADIADLSIAAEVRMYKDHSLIPLLNLKRRLKAVLDGGFELHLQWLCILQQFSSGPLSWDDLDMRPEVGLDLFSLTGLLVLLVWFRISF